MITEEEILVTPCDVSISTKLCGGSTCYNRSKIPVYIITKEEIHKACKDLLGHEASDETIASFLYNKNHHEIVY